MNDDDFIDFNTFRDTFYRGKNSFVIYNKIKENLSSVNKPLTLRNIIIFFNENLNLKDFQSDSEGNLNSFTNILKKIDFTVQESEYDHLKNVSNALTLKLLLGKIDKAKESVMNKISYFIEKSYKEENKKFDNSNIQTILSDENATGIINEYMNKQRPETAHPSNLKNLQKIQPKQFQNFQRESTNKGAIEYVSFCHNRESDKNVSNVSVHRHFDSVTSSPSFAYPDHKKSEPRYNFSEVTTTNYIPLLDKEKAKININLTKYVWPKSRTLLSIISKMYSEGYISNTSRGDLKDLIMDHDPLLIHILNEYEVSGDSEKLYQSIKDLSNEKILNNFNKY